MDIAPTVSIIIVSYNTKVLLRDCLEAVLKTQGLIFEVIVVDNNSSDGTREMIRENFPKIKLIINNENYGFGKANNQGIRASRGEFVLFLNSDTKVDPYAINKLYIHAKNTDRAWVAPKLYNIDGTEQTSCGPFFSLSVVILSLFFQGDRLGLTRWSPVVPTKVDWASGACLLTSKMNLENGLMFDESIFMYMDEVDLLMRAQKKGLETWVFPDVKVIHVGTGSAKEGKKQPVINIYRGLIRIYEKHYAFWQLAILKILLKGKALFAWSIGRLLNNKYLMQTYAEAFKLV